MVTEAFSYNFIVGTFFFVCRKKVWLSKSFIILMTYFGLPGVIFNVFKRNVCPLVKKMIYFTFVR